MEKQALWLVAQQWHTLTRFATELPLPLEANASDEAADYLRYHHILTSDEWSQVKAFARDNRAELEGAEIDARVGRFADADTNDGASLDASTIAAQFRLLFGFAAQYTVNAAKYAHLHLIVWHNLGAPECQAVNEALDAQEVWRGVGTE